MDLDAFTVVHREEWARLKQLAAQRRLSGAEADELLKLYQRASTHLSMIRSVSPEGALSASLSTLLAQARTRFTGARSNVFEDVANFFVLTLPLAFYRIRWLTLAIGAAFVLITVFYAIWVAGNPDVLKALGSDAHFRRYVEEDFVNYYSENPAASFAGQVWTNNAWIAAQEVAFGITGIFVPSVIYGNASSLGMSAGVMFSYGRGDVFFSYILPHGMMEMTAIFIAGAAGLRIFWAWISPGPRRRSESLAVEGRSLITTALGLVLILLISGLVEGFVTPSPMPLWLKLSIGALVLAAYWCYTLILGRRAAKAGYSADLAEQDAGATVPTV
ncbi:stage II sporulation protein M [Psychromicrobium lacuslunae]|uniref:Membrane protein n=1 Tax=Psychromicrobium lacuslunae TaxID=1618207 RepID=A0A0D4BVF9_9MICC|nr:stage II sporulation protein M [Psychromicrobium lacuslunae]AJT40427.1 membrane protein [Psychromicrobium lacuslunae]